MAQTLVKNLLHLIFSTKNREPLITPNLEPDLHRYMTGIIQHCDCHLLAINGTADHVHLLINLSKNWAIAPLVEELKKSSSRWIKSQHPAARGFYWQSGYGAFSIGESAVPAVTTYIANQKQHHAIQSFQEEFLAFLHKYNLPYDERHIWS